MRSRFFLLWLSSSLLALAAACDAPRASPPRVTRLERVDVVEATSLETSSVGRMAARGAPSRTEASFALLRELATDDRAANRLIDPSRGLASIVAGPAYDAQMTAHDVYDAKLLCGEAARREAQRKIRIQLEREKTEGDLDVSYPCEALVCTRRSGGEWDSIISFSFVRASDGTVRLAAMTEVLDFPVSTNAEKNLDWASKRRIELSSRTCEGQAQ